MKFELFDIRGRVKDAEVAREMANIEDPYHKKRLGGLIKPGEKKIKQGEDAALKKGKDLIDKKNFLEAKKEEKKMAESFYKSLLAGLEKNIFFQREMANYDVEYDDCLEIEDAGGDKGSIIKLYGFTEQNRRSPIYKIWINGENINISSKDDGQGWRGSLYRLKDLDKLLSKVEKWAESYRI
ncbi:MAG: hypothetical protein WC459_01140 [Patescibacteria group bacterium]